VKKQKPLEIQEEKAAAARRRARLAVGPVKPSRAIEPKSSKPPRHKKKLQQEEESF
jgi:hypothetical protein